MLFSGKVIGDINENDLLALLGVSAESEAIDFKKFAYPAPPENELPEDQRERDRVRNKWKTDLCTDVVALANANGGWIICGIDEKGGVATELVGLGPTLNLEREIARLEQCIFTGIEPLIPGLQTQPVSLSDSDKSAAIVIRVPRSFNAPHRVRQTRKFHVRRSGRNDEMSIDELRAAFTQFDSLTERVRVFRRSRVQAVLERDQEYIPVPLSDGPALVIHLVPLTASMPTSIVDLSVFGERRSVNWVHLYLNSGRFNLEGYVKSHGDHGYTQVYRNGTLECVEILTPANYGGRDAIDLISLEDLAGYYLRLALHTQQNLGVELPSALLLSVVGAQGFLLVADRKHLIWPLENLIPVQRNVVLLPEIIIDNNVDVTTVTGVAPVLKPVLDLLWNTAGQSGSPSYNAAGDWVRGLR